MLVWNFPGFIQQAYGNFRGFEIPRGDLDGLCFFSRGNHRINILTIENRSAQFGNRIPIC